MFYNCATFLLSQEWRVIWYLQTTDKSNNHTWKRSAPERWTKYRAIRQSSIRYAGPSVVLLHVSRYSMRFIVVSGYSMCFIISWLIHYMSKSWLLLDLASYMQNVMFSLWKELEITQFLISWNEVLLLIFIIVTVLFILMKWIL